MKDRGSRVKEQYKGFEINVEREKCLAGYSMLYYSIFHISDGWELTSGFEDSAETVQEKIEHMKEIVDNYLENPQDYED
jgi:hypothetical protein